MPLTSPSPSKQSTRTTKAVLTRLTAGFQRFQNQWFCKDHNLYAELREGQNPLAMVIACSDSRVDPGLLTDSHPGDLFVIRNVANLVPPYAPDKAYHGVSAALEYAVRHLHVPDIIVMGHAECGG
ncbi:MAG: carbonic anhydrase, partial [Bilophila sp.]